MASLLNSPLRRWGATDLGGQRGAGARPVPVWFIVLVSRFQDLGFYGGECDDCQVAAFVLFALLVLLVLCSLTGGAGGGQV